MFGRGNQALKPYARWSTRRRYWFERFMSRGIFASLAALTMVFVTLFVVVGVGRAVAVRSHQAPVERGRGFLRQIWITWLEMTDPGTQAYDIDSSGWFKVFAVIAAVLGIVMLSAVIAVMTTALEAKMRDLRTGHTEIVESGHTVILGWNDRIVQVLRELIEANESEPSAVIAILAPVEKEMMDAHLDLHLPARRRGTTRVITRNGAPTDTVDLRIVSPASAKSVIILSSHEDPTRADLEVLKAALATVVQSPESGAPVVVELVSKENHDVLVAIAPERIVAVYAEELLGKIMVQCSRTEGLATVYSEMLSFEGAEMYFDSDHGADGLRFSQLVFHYPDGVPIGIERASGEILLNVHADEVLRSDDEILLLTEDDSTISWSPEPLWQGESPRIPGVVGSRGVERALILGWSDKAETIIRELDEYLQVGSAVDVVSRGEDRAAEAVCRLRQDMQRVDVELVDADPHCAEGMEQIGLNDYDSVILLAQPGPGCGDGEDTDSDTLTMLLRYRNRLVGASVGSPTPTSEGTDRGVLVVSEVLNPANADLLVQAGVNDCIVSTSMVSSIMAQMSEEPEMARVYEALFAESGPEVYLKPASWYFDTLPIEVTFWDVIARVAQRNEKALGYRLVRDYLSSSSENFGIRLNPTKDQPILMTELDRVVVLAENEL